VEVELVDQAEPQRLVHGAGATHEVDVLVPGRHLRLRDRDLDVRDEGEAGRAGHPDRVRPVGRYEDRHLERRVLAPAVHMVVGRAAGHDGHDGTGAGEHLLDRPGLAAGPQYAVAARAEWLLGVGVRAGDEPVERHGQGDLYVPMGPPGSVSDVERTLGPQVPQRSDRFEGRPGRGECGVGPRARREHHGVAVSWTALPPAALTACVTHRILARQFRARRTDADPEVGLPQAGST
jgi:hypothetical protein